MVLADKLRCDADWAYHELATTHDAMGTMPDETADLLMRIAAD